MRCVEEESARQSFLNWEKAVVDPTYIETVLNATRETADIRGERDAYMGFPEQVNTISS